MTISGDANGIPRLNHAILTYSEVRTGGGIRLEDFPNYDGHRRGRVSAVQKFRFLSRRRALPSGRRRPLRNDFVARRVLARLPHLFHWSERSMGHIGHMRELAQILVQRADLASLRPAQRNAQHHQDCSNSSCNDRNHRTKQRSRQS